MSLTKQIGKLKENWLIIVILIIALFIFSGAQNLFYGISGVSYSLAGNKGAYVSEEYDSYDSGRIYYGGQNNFAPQELNRLITKNSYLSSEVQRGKYKDAETELKSIIKNTEGFLLDENVNQYDSGWKTYFSGTYLLKVPVSRYDQVLSQLKKIGETKSFRENTQDITGGYTDLKTELDAERSRLQRYIKMYEEATLVTDKITLNDKIFEQERRVQYLDAAFKNENQRIDYSQISFTLSEKRPEYFDITFVKLSELVKNTVQSLNLMFRLMFMILPWLALFFGVRLALNLKHKKGSK